MTDRPSTPSPGTESSDGATAQATQVIRTPDPTLTIQQPTQATDPTLAIPQPARVTEPTLAIQQPARVTEPTPAIPQLTRATAQAAARARAHAVTARTAAGRARNVAGRLHWKAANTAAQPWYMRKRVALPSAVIATFAFLMITTGGNNPAFFSALTNAAKLNAQGIPHAPPARAVMGQSVRDGKFAFMVTGRQTTAKSFTDRFGVRQSAQGIFVIVRIRVSNIGYDARSLNPTDLFLVDDLGRRYATSSAILSFGGAETIFLHKINPGHIVNNAPLVFDVAPETVITSIEFHDSMTSRGVQVKLP